MREGGIGNEPNGGKPFKDYSRKMEDLSKL